MILFFKSVGIFGVFFRLYFCKFQFCGWQMVLLSKTLNDISIFEFVCRLSLIIDGLAFYTFVNDFYFV